MATTPQEEKLEALRARVAALEHENAEITRRANAVVAGAQEKAYWLDRWNVDLNALMHRRGASQVRATVRGVRSVYWVARYRLLKPFLGRLRG